MEDLREIHDPNTYWGAVRARVDEYIFSADGKFYLSDVYDFAGARDDRAKSAVRTNLSRAKKDGRIKPCDGRAGCYRPIERDFEVVDLMTLNDTAPMAVNLPLGIGHMVEIFPKDLICFAGTPNQGKTTFMLESVRLNMGRFDCYYFSSEMSARACRNRISKHLETPLKDWKIKFVESFTDYADVIQPDDLNLVDYVEPVDGEYFKVPSILSSIQRRLKNGVAIVALQKNPGASYGVGGQQTKAKPSIFCTLEGNICKIEKAKNFDKINPNGYTAKFKIFDGINLSRVGNWTPP
jgi:hypothetical protein